MTVEASAAVLVPNSSRTWSWSKLGREAQDFSKLPYTKGWYFDRMVHGMASGRQKGKEINPLFDLSKEIDLC